MNLFFKIKRSEKIISDIYDEIIFDFDELDTYILDNFTDLEIYILTQYYENKISLKNIALNKKISYSYARQIIHYARQKIIVFISAHSNNT